MSKPKPPTASTIPVHCSYARLADVTSLIPNPRNPNKHSDKQVALLAKVIRHQGWRAPITISKRSGFIVTGHGRLAAALLLQVEQVPIDEQDFATEADEWAHLVADNRLAELADADRSMIADLLKDLDAEGVIDMDLTGFDMDALDELMEEENPTDITEDDVPDVPVDPITQPGDLWILGEHRVLCGDSTKAEDVQRLMAGKKADMVFTDPPYGVSYTDSLGRSIKNDDLTDCDLQKFLRDAFATGVAVTAADAPWYVWHASRYQREFENALNDCSINVKQQIIWVKGEGVDGTAQVRAPAIGRSDFRWLHEPCFYASRGNPFNAGDRKTTTVWTVSRPTTGTVHPTQKPIPLIEIALENSAKNNAMVLDLFGGSGSTLIACEKTSRQARLMELDPRYCDVIVKRWENLTGKKAVLSNEH